MSKNIRISRYQKNEELPKEAFCADGTFPWFASVEPEDGSWVLFVPIDPEQPPQLWLNVGTEDNGDGTGRDVFAPAGQPLPEVPTPG